MDNKRLHFSQLSCHSDAMSILGFRVRKRGCLHVLPWGVSGEHVFYQAKKPQTGVETATTPIRPYRLSVETMWFDVDFCCFFKLAVVLPRLKKTTDLIRYSDPPWNLIKPQILFDATGHLRT